MEDHGTGGEAADVARVEAQYRSLPPRWRAFDRGVVQTTEFIVFMAGILFTVMVTLEVLSRYVFNFSIFFINAAARMLLVWFFMLGAGLALRRGAHIGFEFAVRALAAGRSRIVLLIGQVLLLVFFLQMLWSGLHTLGPSMGQSEPGLGISLFWVMLAIPAGFGLLIYHAIALVVVALRRTSAEVPRP